MERRCGTCKLYEYHGQGLGMCLWEAPCETPSSFELERMTPEEGDHCPCWNASEEEARGAEVQSDD